MASNIRVLDEDSPMEVAFWEANSEMLAEQYPDKYLIVCGEEVAKVFDTVDELMNEAKEYLAANPGILCFTSKKPAFSPYSQVVDSA